VIAPLLAVTLELEASAYLSKAKSAPAIFGAVMLASVPGPPLMPTVYGIEWLHVTETAAVAFVPAAEYGPGVAADTETAHVA
jgi:hypothetical protein